MSRSHGVDNFGHLSFGNSEQFQFSSGIFSPIPGDFGRMCGHNRSCHSSHAGHGMAVVMVITVSASGGST